MTQYYTSLQYKIKCKERLRNTDCSRLGKIQKQRRSQSSTGVDRERDTVVGETLTCKERGRKR